jgi:hypothetical protein
MLGSRWWAVWALGFGVGCSAGNGTGTEAEAGSGEPPDGAVTGACNGERTLVCSYFDGASGRWSGSAPARLSMARSCTPSGGHGEIDAFVETASQYWLDQVGFHAGGSAVRIAPFGTSADAGGTTYGCGQGGGKVFTHLLCGMDVGTGSLSLDFDFAGRWADGTPWSHTCHADVEVVP